MRALHLTPHTFKRVNGYLIAGAVSLAALLLQGLLRLWAGDQIPFLFVLPAMVFVAVTLGRGPGLVVMAAGTVNAIFWAAGSPRWSSAPEANAAILLPYLALGAFIIFYGSRLGATTARAAQAERRLSMAQEETGVGVFELDFEGGKAFVTPALCRMLGVPVMNGPVDLEPWLAALSASHVEETRRVLQEKVDRGELYYEREQRIELNSGGFRWVLNRVTIDVGRDGKLAQARGAAVDITERKRLDESLRGVQEELSQQVHDLRRLHEFAQQLVTRQDDAVAPMQALIELVVELYRAEHGLLWLANESGTGFRVAAQSGFVDNRALDLMPSTQGAPARPLEEGRQGGGLDPSQCERALSDHRAAAERSGFHAVHSTALRVSSGAVIGFISVLFAQEHATGEREIRLGEVLAATAAALAERDMARDAAAVNERRFTVALESSLVPFTILAPVRGETGDIVDFKWTYINASAARLLDVDARAAVGKRIGQVLQPTWVESDIFRRYIAVVERGEACDFEARTTSAHKRGWLQIRASPLPGSVAVWFADITEQKRQQQDLLDADRRKDEFLATLAHELRNPLAPMRQAILVSRSAKTTADQKQWGFDVVERQVRNMARLLDDLLDVSRITRGTLELHRSKVQLSEVIEAALETSRPHIDGKKHRLIVDVPLPGWTMDVDPLRMSQVLGNLLINAAKYTDPGGVIRLSAQVDPHGLEIRILDNGVGFTPDQFDRLFEMFSQMPASAGRSQGGLGIGLALARGIVELHDGQIAVSSPGPGLGSEFCVRLPIACLEQNPPLAVEAPAMLPNTPAAEVPSRRVIVADDNADAAESLAEMLRLDGHDVRVCFDGEQALEEFRTFQPDIALLDVGMPLLSGLEVARAIRSLPPGQRATLIAVTGWGQVRDQELALDAGFDRHMTKPVQPSQIRALIAESGKALAH